MPEPAPHPISKVVPSHPTEEAHFSCLYLGSRSFGHDPKFMAKGEGRNVDRPLAAFDHFFGAGGCKTISFVYQECEVPGIECGRTYPGQATGEKVPRLFLADLAKTCLTGVCCYFMRTRVDVPVTPEKIHEEVCFSMIDATDGLLKGIRDAYAFLLPVLETQESWGALDQSRHGEKIKKNFLDNYKHFLSSLDDLQVRNDGVVHLSTVSDVDFSKLTCVDEMKAAAANTAMLERLEEILGQWCKEIEE
ncbi:hypothetical protein CHARACLAT_019308, partial [Characodon lateralis]|nr:hypothetical protein [Characodon lateralis]